MKWNVLRGKKGQPEHIFSDALPGIGLILLSILIIEFFHTDAYEGLEKKLDEQIAQVHAERQLVAFLQTPLLFRGKHGEVWQVLLKGREEYQQAQHPEDRDEVAQISGLFSIFARDYGVVESTAFSIFNELYGVNHWYLLVHYGTGEISARADVIELGHYGALGDSCSRNFNKKFVEGSAAVFVPGDQPLEVRLHYCTVI